MNRLSPSLAESRWPHRLAVALACATFPVIWVGGLVTTFEAGMAVPDWPSTYGYNLFLYPWQTWLLGPWDLFIEHGHRLLAAFSGLLTMALVFVLFRVPERRWVRGLALAALALVVTQGTLGGLRVLFDARLLARVHGCLGPAFFAVTVSLAVCTSRGWRTAAAHPAPRALGALAFAPAVSLAGLTYAQLMLGASVRHADLTWSPGGFRALLLVHLALGLAVVGYGALVAWRIRRTRAEGGPVRLAAVLGLLFGAQAALGMATWVVNYGWPAWCGGWRFSAGHVVLQHGFLQAYVTTAHVALGSLLLAAAVALALRVGRLVGSVGRSGWEGAA